jgi:hypothetical protein
VFACSAAALKDLHWLTKMTGADTFDHLRATAEKAGHTRHIVALVDVEKGVWMRGFCPAERVATLSISPRQTSWVDRQLRLDQLKLLINFRCDSELSSDDSLEGYSTVDALYDLASIARDPDALYLWRQAEDELKQKEKDGFAMNSRPDEAATRIYQYLGGHIVQQSPHNLTTFVLPTKGEHASVLSKGVAHYMRGPDPASCPLDRAILCDMCVTLRRDYRVEFAPIRHVPRMEPLQPANLFSITQNLAEEYGPGGCIKKPYEWKHKRPPADAVPPYKAIWTSLVCMVVLFPSGELVIMRTISAKDHVARTAFLRNQDRNAQTDEFIRKAAVRRMEAGKAGISADIKSDGAE